MEKNVYRRLVGVLDTLPNGFPATGNGVEIRLPEKIFTPGGRSSSATCA